MRISIVFAIATLAACGPEAEAPEQPTAKFSVISGKDVLSMVIPSQMSPEQIIAQARDECGARDFCQVHGWLDEADAARAFPMTDREVETMAFQYSHNRSTGSEKRLFDCERLKREDASECL